MKLVVVFVGVVALASVLVATPLEYERQVGGAPRARREYAENSTAGRDERGAAGGGAASPTEGSLLCPDSASPSDHSCWGGGYNTSWGSLVSLFDNGHSADDNFQTFLGNDQDIIPDE